MISYINWFPKLSMHSNYRMTKKRALRDWKEIYVSSCNDGSPGRFFLFYIRTRSTSLHTTTCGLLNDRIMHPKLIFVLIFGTFLHYFSSQNPLELYFDSSFGLSRFAACVHTERVISFTALKKKGKIKDILVTTYFEMVVEIKEDDRHQSLHKFIQTTFLSPHLSDTQP